MHWTSPKQEILRRIFADAVNFMLCKHLAANHILLRDAVIYACSHRTIKLPIKTLAHNTIYWPTFELNVLFRINFESQYPLEKINFGIY